MSNAQSNRPRRSFATGSTQSTSSQPVPDVLRYDGEDVPVLIRLPDLSPQALLREPAAPGAPHVSPTKTVPNSLPVEEKAEAASEPAPASAVKKTPDAPATPAALPTAAASPQTSSPTTATARGGERAAVDSHGERAGGERAPSEPSSSTTSDATPAAAADSSRKRRHRKRGGRKQGGQPAGNLQSSPSRESRHTSPKNGPATHVARQDESIPMFDKSRLLIGVGLVVVAGLTYFALSGGSEDPVEPAGTWGGADPGSVVQTSDQNSETDVDLWPAEQDGEMHQTDSTQTDPTLANSGTTTPAAGPAWPEETGSQPANSYDRATTPAADYSYNAPPITPPANGQNDTSPTYAAPVNDGPTSGWPPESSTPAQPTSATQPVQSWPDAAMAEPPTGAPTGAPRDYYQSQAAGYTVSPSTTGGYGDAPPVRTGRLETGTYPGGSLGTADNPGSQLNGTIEIPRPRANNEYNGSSVY